jgi:thymidylate synthase
MEITAINVNTLFEDALWRFKTSGVKTTTRNGEAYCIDEPVLTKITEPTERVLFYGRRDANPIFHLMESIWMLAGRRDVAFLEQFNSKIGQFSDDGEVFNSAYGYRMRHHFGVDQLVGVIEHLTKDSKSRQAVIQLWDADDLTKDTKDRACNTQMVFAIKNGCLDLTVFNRSNDFWWGYAGANAVHFTFIQEFVAIALCVPIGTYYTVTNNLHLYTHLYDAMPEMLNPPKSDVFDYYSLGTVKPYQLFNGKWTTFLQDCEMFCEKPFDDTITYQHPFFKEVAQPMAMVSFLRKHKLGSGHEQAQLIKATDWQIAVMEWIGRRNVSK